MAAKFYDIDSLLDEVVTLPSLPTTLAHIMRLLEDPNCEMSEVAAVIATDPAIALKCLRLVNSAYFGLGQEVASVEHAVVLLGMRVIKNLVLTATVFEAFDNMAEMYMQHSVACGIAMRALAHMRPLQQAGETPDGAFVFGLLHDIGKVILEQYLPEEYAQVSARVASERIPWHCAEREVLGVDHAELGARLAAHWKLQPQIVGAIAGHHNLSRAGEHRLLSANLNIADYLCHTAGFPSYRPSFASIPTAMWQTCGLSSSDLPELLERFVHQMPALRDIVHQAA